MDWEITGLLLLAVSLISFIAKKISESVPWKNFGSVLQVSWVGLIIFIPYIIGEFLLEIILAINHKFKKKYF